MRSGSLRRPGRKACLLFTLGALLAGCGTSGTVQGGNDTFSATTLTVYSDLPLLGPQGAQMTSIVDGEMLALYDAGGHVGKLHVSLQSLNDFPEPLIADPLHLADAQIGQSAHTASSDLSTAAFIGDFDSAATAISLPLDNQNDVLQVSPGSSYVGFTDANAADYVGDPTRFYGYGSRTFARLVPSDLAEAKATVTYMRSLGVARLEVLEDNSDPPYDLANPPYDGVIATLVASDARAAGITVVGQHTGIDTQTDTRPGDYSGIAAAVAARHPDAVLLGGAPDGGADALWRELHAKLPGAKLFAPSTLATPAFLGRLGPAASATYVTSSILEPSQYPAAAQSVFAQYRRMFSLSPTAYVLYGYDAMNDILLAIRKAGRLAARRQSLLYAFFHLGPIKGAIGDYTINASGDTSLASFDGYRVSAGGELVLVRRIS
jgi:branched-chain amino acid transport system substrate-binding protein